MRSIALVGGLLVLALVVREYENRHTSKRGDLHVCVADNGCYSQVGVPARVNGSQLEINLQTIVPAIIHPWRRLFAAEALQDQRPGRPL